MNTLQESDVIENVISTVGCPTSRLFRIVSVESVWQCVLTGSSVARNYNSLHKLREQGVVVSRDLCVA